MIIFNFLWSTPALIPKFKRITKWFYLKASGPNTSYFLSIQSTLVSCSLKALVAPSGGLFLTDQMTVNLTDIILWHRMQVCICAISKSPTWDIPFPALYKPSFPSLCPDVIQSKLPHCFLFGLFADRPRRLTSTKSLSSLIWKRSVLVVLGAPKIITNIRRPHDRNRISTSIIETVGRNFAATHCFACSKTMERWIDWPSLGHYFQTMKRRITLVCGRSLFLKKCWPRSSGICPIEFAFNVVHAFVRFINTFREYLFDLKFEWVDFFRYKLKPT